MLEEIMRQPGRIKIAKPRIWTPEQRLKAANRMRETQKARWDKKREGLNEMVQGVATMDAALGTNEAPHAVVLAEPKSYPPEVQAVIDTMDPVRKMKLAGYQSKVLNDPDVQAALERKRREESQEVVAPNLPPDRIGSREVNLVVRTDGTMVSVTGSCVCGRAKREWHTICLKEENGRRF
jgi:hypothetical protein